MTKQTVEQREYDRRLYRIALLTAAALLCLGSFPLLFLI